MSISSRARAWTVAAACASFLSLGTIIQAKEAPEVADLGKCRAEVWRVVNPLVVGSSKSTLSPRVESRRVFVCDDKTFEELQQRVGKGR